MTRRKRSYLHPCDTCGHEFRNRGYRIVIRGEGVSRYFCSGPCLAEWAAEVEDLQ